MEPNDSNSKRKRVEGATSSSWLHPGGWRGAKRAKSVSPSRSPSASGASTPNEASTHGPPQYHQNSQSSRQTPEAQASTGMSTGNTASAPNPAASGWSGLEQTLRALRITTNICPSLGSAVDDLTSCLPIFEEAAKNRQDYDDLATGLKSIVSLLIKCLHNAPSKDVIDCISAISEAIRKEIESIGVRQSDSGFRRIIRSQGDDEDLIRRYRRIEQLFRQLQGEASMSTWNITSKQYIDTQLEKLHPARPARFDSGLSNEIGRRTCTENTRTQVLQESTEWSENSNSAKIYWMNGMAGTGKTTIACSLCNALDARKQLAASFFCTRTSPECRQAKNIVPTVAYQFARRSTPFRSALCKALEDDPDISAGSIASQFDLLLKRPLTKVKDKLPHNLVIIVDALDECTDPHIVELFLDLLFRSIGDLPIKFYVTSRPEPVIRNRMISESERSRSILYLHEIEKSLVQADIELYLKEELAFMSPSDSDIEELAEHAGNLFIYAATAIRYIRPPGKAVNSLARLSAILAINTGQKKLSGIDDLYSAILSAAIDDKELEPDEQHLIRLVLWTTICACEPILISTLSALCGSDNIISTINALQPLRSVLHISDQSELVTTLHASFPDYMLDRERSEAFHCNQAIHSQLITERCFKIMQSQLRFNICDIPTSCDPDDEIPGLEQRINTNITEELYYTCRFWVDHLSQADPIEPLMPQVQGFLSTQVLFWMEVLSLKKCLTTGTVSASKLNRCLAQMTHTDSYSHLSKLATDVYGFIVGYLSSPASAYTAHIYLSALPLCSPSSQLRSLYLPMFKGLVKVSGRFLDSLEQASLSTWESTHPLRCAAFSPGGNLVLGGETGKISVQNAYDGKYLVKPFKAHMKPVTSIGISNDGTKIVSCSNDKTLCIWSMWDGSLIFGPFKGHTKCVASVGFSSDALRIVSGSDDCVVGIWNSQDASIPMRSFTGHAKAVKSVAFSPDGLHVVSGSADRTIRLWEVSTGDTTLVLKRHTGPITSVQFTTDGAYIISGSNDRSICIWNAPDGTLVRHPLQGHSEYVTSVAVSPDGGCIASGSFDCTVRVWDKRTGELIAGPLKGHSKPIRSVGFSNDGMRIVSASDDGTVRVWNVHAKVQQKGPSSRKFSWIHSCQYFTISPCQTQVAVLHDFSIHIWELQTEVLVASVAIDSAFQIQFLQFSLDNTRIFALLSSGHMCTWNIPEAKLANGPHPCSIGRLTNPLLSAACSADGTRVVTCCTEEVGVWDAQSHQRIAYHETGAERGSGTSKPLIIISPRGTRFATMVYSQLDSSRCTESIIQVWDTESGNIRAEPFVGDRLLDLSPDGSAILCCNVGGSSGFKMINPDSGVIKPMPKIDVGSISYSEYISARFSPSGLHVIYSTRTGIYIWNTCDHKVVIIQPAEFPQIQSFAYAPDGWCLLGGSLNHPVDQATIFQVWRFHIDQPFCVTIRGDGWVTDTGSRLLLWVPAAIRPLFLRRSGFTIESDGGICASVDYSGLLVGDDWSKCYIGS